MSKAWLNLHDLGFAIVNNTEARCMNCLFLIFFFDK
jgi:hypothetical protein